MKNNFLAAKNTHPGSWWLVGLSLAIAASLSKNLLTLTAIATCSMLIVLALRDDAPWAKSITFYLRLAVVVVLIRVVFRIIFNMESNPEQALIQLPLIQFSPMDNFEISLLGPISSHTLLSALVDGMRLAAIILSVGMANSLANPRKLLKATPGALYEIATALSIAINLAPQLIASMNRVRRARSLRGQSKGMKALPGIVIPVLEDTIDQSMSLAASMSARGFGRKGTRIKRQQLAIRFIGLASITLLALGVFLLLITPSTQVADISMVALGVFFAFLYIRISAAGSVRTRFAKEPYRLGDYILLASSGCLVALAFSGVLNF